MITQEELDKWLEIKDKIISTIKSTCKTMVVDHLVKTKQEPTPAHAEAIWNRRYYVDIDLEEYPISATVMEKAHASCCSDEWFGTYNFRWFDLISPAGLINKERLKRKK